MKNISSKVLWAAILTVVAAAQAYTVYGQQKELVGSWKNSSTGTISYQNRVTGATRPGRGSIFTYKFNADGTFEYVGYLEMTMYSCTTTLFNNTRGRYSISGSTLTLNLNKDHWKTTNSCAASGNKTENRPAKRQTMTFVFKNDDYGKQQLCLTTENGESCFSREQ